MIVCSIHFHHVHFFFWCTFVTFWATQLTFWRPLWPRAPGSQLVRLMVVPALGAPHIRPTNLTWRWAASGCAALSCPLGYSWLISAGVAGITPGSVLQTVNRNEQATSEWKAASAPKAWSYSGSRSLEITGVLKCFEVGICKEYRIDTGNGGIQ